jgi:hypothetical protein
MRRIWGPIAIVAASAVLLVEAPAASAISSPPPPTQAVSPPAPQGAVDVFGETAAGDVFFNAPTADPRGSVRHADGSVTALTRTFGGRGDMGPDGRLWLPISTSLWAFGADGSSTEYPITTPDGTTTTGINEVRSGIDGRIWFTDTQRSRVGSIAPDGTGASVIPIPGGSTLGGLEHLARGTDGRMWVSRSKGTLYAVASDGTVTTYPAIGRPVAGLASNPSGLYAMVGSTLLKISATGATTPVALPVTSQVGGVPVSSSDRIWIGSGSPTVISPSGRISQFSVPVEYTVQDLQGGNLFVYPDRVAVAPSQAGGFVGVVGPTIVRIPNPDVEVNLKVRTTVVSARGANVLRVVASARTPGGAARSGTYEVRIGWSRFIPEGPTTIERQTRRIGSVQVTNGTGTVDIPLTPAMLAGTPVPDSLDHGDCCSVLLRTSDGLSSVIGAAGRLAPSRTMAYLDRMNHQALGRSMDTAGITYWASKLAAGTPRTTVARSIVDSTAWRRQRVTSAYQRWLGRKPDAGGLDYWQNWLRSHTTSDLDLQLGTTPAGRDAGGTSTGQRANHLAAALRLSSASADSFRKQLAAGTSWSSLVRSAYFSNSASQRRMSDLAPRSAFTPSLASLVAEFRSSRDERGPLVKALATMP